jgi:hypothetical protein
MRTQGAMRIHTAPGISAGNRNTAVRWIKRCLREITRKHYELPVDYATASADIMIKLKLAGQRSSACAKGVNIDLAPYDAGNTQILEYPAFAKDPVIGSRHCQHPEMVLAATIAHEVSHFIQYRYGPQTRWLKQKYRKPHGEGFQDIYRILRSRVVNPEIRGATPDRSRTQA